MLEINLNMYHATAIAAIVLLLGRFIVSKVPLLRNYCIPAPVVGGIVYALVHLGLYAAGIATISFDGTLQSFFMTVFFCSVGFMASFKLLKKGGIQVVIFLAVSIVLVLLQDVLGTGMAAAFGLDPRLGLCIGSIPMVGGHGTAGSFGPLIENLGVTGAATVAIAAAPSAWWPAACWAAPSPAPASRSMACIPLRMLWLRTTSRWSPPRPLRTTAS